MKNLCLIKIVSGLLNHLQQFLSPLGKPPANQVAVDQYFLRPNARVNSNPPNPDIRSAPADGSGTAIRFNVVKPPELPTTTSQSTVELKDTFGTLARSDLEIFKKIGDVCACYAGKT